MRISIIALLCVGLTAPAAAQSLRLQPKNTDQPIDIDAPGGMEIQQDTKRYVARGTAEQGAVLTQGDVSVTAVELVADYRETTGGGNEIYRVYATGRVTMKSASETASGEAAVYDVDKAVLVLQGDLVTLTSADGSVTAHKTLQYWSNERVAVAEGAASAIDRNKHQINGDKLIAFFREETPGSVSKTATAKGLQQRARGDINYVQGFGNVVMKTSDETIRSDRGAYNIDTGIATLEGNIKLASGLNQGAGGFAVLNVKSDRYTLYGNAAQAGVPGMKENARVRALIAPEARPQTNVPEARPQTAAPEARPQVATPAAKAKP